MRLQERVLQPPLNSYLLLAHHDLVGLVETKLSLRNFGDVDRPLLRLHDVPVIYLLVD